MSKFKFDLLHLVMTLIIVFLIGVLCSNWDKIRSTTATVNEGAIHAAVYLCGSVNSRPSKISVYKPYWKNMSETTNKLVENGSVLCENNFSAEFTVAIGE